MEEVGWKRVLGVIVILPMVADVAAQAPVGHWDFRDEATVVPDRSGNGNGLRVEGCARVPSKRGTAFRVPAQSGRIWCEKPSDALRPARTLSLIAWVRPLGTGHYCAVVNHGKGWGEEGTVGYRLLVYPDGVRLLLRAGRVINISGGKPVRGQWNQVAATYDGKEAAVFLNGQVAARTRVEGAILYEGVEDVFEVGCGDGGDLDGDIASLKVFDRALSEAQIAADWRAGQDLLSGPGGDHRRTLREAGEVFPGSVRPTSRLCATATRRCSPTWTPETTATPTTPAGKAAPAAGG